jgi:hypothetical protein
MFQIIKMFLLSYCDYHQIWLNILMNISNFLTNSSINFTYAIYAHISKFHKPFPTLSYAISTQILNVIMQNVKKVLLHEHFETQQNLRGVIYFF